MLTLFLDLIDSQEDRDRFIYIYQTYNSFLYNYIRKDVNDEYAAQDILQDVFLKVAQIIYRIETDDALRLRKYLLIITRSKINNYYKSQQKIIANEEPYEDNIFEISTTSGLDEILNTVSATTLTDAIEKLDHTYRDPLVLHYVYDNDINEIAKLYNITPNGVRKRLARAQIKLRELLKESNYFI